MKIRGVPSLIIGAISAALRWCSNAHAVDRGATNVKSVRRTYNFEGCATSEC